MANDPFGDRMKRYEEVETDRRILHGVPVIGRVDGRAFHRFTTRFDRPYEKSFSDVMIEVTKFLVEETDAVCGYTQSDEISIVWREPVRLRDTGGIVRQFHVEQWFGGKTFKMTSNLASLATAAFCSLYQKHIDKEKLVEGLLPTFDARVFAVPNRMEAAACLWWRELDATRNSLQMAARAHFSHNQCQGKIRASFTICCSTPASIGTITRLSLSAGRSYNAARSNANFPKRNLKIFLQNMKLFLTRIK